MNHGIGPGPNAKTRLKTMVEATAIYAGHNASVHAANRVKKVNMDMEKIVTYSM